KKKWYLVIRYRNIKFQKYVWANRDTPLFGLNGTLRWVETKGSLQVWLSTFSQDNQLKLVVAELLENGNFILKDAYNRTCSESFDFPGDTILP
ncbi:hypothetical protein HID58_076201, partial [Brassica napus]